MYRILIFNDSKWRDLPGTALLKYKLDLLLENNPSVVSVAPFTNWSQALNLFNPHIVILNHIQGQRNRMIASHVVRHGGIACVLFNEGIVEFEDKRKVFAEQANDELISAFYCWNELTAELVGNGAAVGSPRFEIYSTKYRELIDTKSMFCDKHGFDCVDKMVVFGDSWPSAKFSYSLQSFHKQDWKDLGNTVADKWSDPAKFAKDQYDYVLKFRSLILSAKAFFPNIQIAVSIHPMSDFRDWNKWGDENGIKIVKDYIFNILNGADVFVGRLGSIGITESWILGKPAIKLGTEYFTAFSGEQWAMDTLNSSFSPEQFMAVLGDALEVNHVYFPKGVIDFLKKWGIYPLDAATLIAEDLFGYLPQIGEPIGGYDLSAYSGMLASQDKSIKQNLQDSYGNWDKAVTQKDVTDWINRYKNARL